MDLIKVVKIVGDTRINIGVIVSISMKRDGVALIGLPSDERIVASASDKESDFDIVFFQNVEELGGIGAGAVVES